MGDFHGFSIATFEYRYTVIVCYSMLYIRCRRELYRKRLIVQIQSPVNSNLQPPVNYDNHGDT